MANENREHKSTVFADLYYEDVNAAKNILELYNGIYGTNYTDESMVEFIRLEDVLFNNFKNDVAFIVGKQRILLSEHQSTINENMPVRQLLYAAREFEKLIPVKDRYRKSRIKLPMPVFYTFYNGREDYPEEMELKLSDAFLVKPTESEPSMELTVKVININPDKQHELLTKCPVLKEYSEFVEIARSYGNEKNALEKAVKECIKKNILREYLLRKSTEVVNMLMAEYDHDMEMEVFREEITEKVTEKVTKEVTDKVTKDVTDKVTKDVTDKVTKDMTDKAAKQEKIKLIGKVTMKLKKGKDVSTIADDLAEPEEEIRAIVEVVEKLGIDSEVDLIYKNL